MRRSWKRFSVLLITISVNGAGIIVNFLSSKRVTNACHVAAGTGRASSRCNLVVARFLQLDNCTPNSISSIVVASIIPGIVRSFHTDVIGFLGVSPVVIKPKIGANVGVHVSGPRGVNTSYVTSYTKTCCRCNKPVLITSFNATAAFGCIATSTSIVYKLVAANVHANTTTL